jgi:N-acetylglucosamine kinase-like BadF-type ATPase
MILVADSGSTKTEWKVFKDGIAEESVFSSGINPFFLTSEDIFLLFKKELDNFSGYQFDIIYFYGTGCNSEAKNNTVKNALSRFFPCDKILIGTDLLGAARSLCQNSQGIACIMGTGSNSCYYDGRVIVSNVAPLGYILGDEGGGAVIGRKLISAVLKKQVPQPVIDLFIDTYKITPAEILERVYMKPFPNRFLGQFAKFVSSNIQIPELQEIVTTSFEEFIKRNVLQYPESGILPIHFTGSIAIHFRGFLEELLRKYSLNPGIFTLSPMENLIKYHIQNLNTGLI